MGRLVFFLFFLFSHVHKYKSAFFIIYVSGSLGDWLWITVNINDVTFIPKRYNHYNLTTSNFCMVLLKMMFISLLILSFFFLQKSAAEPKHNLEVQVFFLHLALSRETMCAMSFCCHPPRWSDALIQCITFTKIMRTFFIPFFSRHQPIFLALIHSSFLMLSRIHTFDLLHIHTWPIILRISQLSNATSHWKLKWWNEKKNNSSLSELNWSFIYIKYIVCLFV